MHNAIKLYLHRDLGKPNARRLGAAPEPEASFGPPQAGFRGWIVRKCEHFKKRWQESRTGLTGAVHRVWVGLHKRLPADEPLLADFRRTRRIDVHHPEALSTDEAQSLWESYLAARRRRHLPRFLINLLIAPLTIVLGPLPGPNLVGYWFGYRSIHHFLILYGLWRVRTGRVAVAFEPVGDEAEPAIAESLSLNLEHVAGE